MKLALQYTLTDCEPVIVECGVRALAAVEKQYGIHVADGMMTLEQTGYAAWTQAVMDGAYTGGFQQWWKELDDLDPAPKALTGADPAPSLGTSSPSALELVSDTGT